MKAPRILACLVLAALAVASAVIVARQPSDTSQGLSPGLLPLTDPLVKELERCQLLNEKAGSDEKCQAAYAESRRQFFQPPPEYHPVPIQMYPDVPQPKLVKPDQPQGR
ncbi:MAG: Conjugative transfer region protein TrbK [Aliidongia sp.]|nr:Conjugative transfer region protein TrbK [Aliidongia sp.]